MLLAVSIAGRQVVAEGLGEIGKYSANRRGRHQSVGSVIYGSGTCSDTVHIGVFGPVVINGKMVKRFYTGFLRQTRGKRVRRITGRTWVTPTAGEVWEAVGMQSAAT